MEQNTELPIVDTIAFAEPTKDQREHNAELKALEKQGEDITEMAGVAAAIIESASEKYPISAAAKFRFMQRFAVPTPCTKHFDSNTAQVKTKKRTSSGDRAKARKKMYLR